jgi:hypothetical protein
VAFTQDGKVLRVWHSSFSPGEPGVHHDAPFADPRALATDTAGHIYMVDWLGNQILRLTTD